MKKLDACTPLGYSCAGEVIGLTSDTQNGFCIGDLVACGGFTASHSEVVNVPSNLCVKLKPNVDFKQAAYNTLGAIAMQLLPHLPVPLIPINFAGAIFRKGGTIVVVGAVPTVCPK